MTDPIPAKLWERIKAWLADEHTGTITLGINQGRVKDYEIREFGKIPADGGIDKEQELRVQ